MILDQTCIHKSQNDSGDMFHFLDKLKCLNFKIAWITADCLLQGFSHMMSYARHLERETNPVLLIGKLKFLKIL